MNILKKALGLAFVLGWAGTTIAADAPVSGQASGSLPPAAPAPVQVCSPVGNCCDNGSCAIDHDCCDHCVPGSGIIFGAEWHLIRPVINDNVAFTTTTSTATTSAKVSTPYQYNFESDPSIWMGYRSCDGLGFQVTWFHMNQNSDPVGSTINSTTGTSKPPVTVTLPFFTIFSSGLFLPISVASNGDIKMDIWDFDVTQRVEIGHLDLTFGGGIRYFHMAQDANTVLDLSADARVRTSAGTISATASNSFDGGGPTLILDGLRRFGSSGFGLYANARGGVLFGAQRENTFESYSPSLAAFFTVTHFSTTSDQESTIGFGEIELGIQWGQSNCSVSPFVRIGFEGREYWGIGNAILATSGNNSGNVGAYGFVASAGVGW
jgi:hypothetical protein